MKKLSVLFKVLFALKMLLANLQHEQRFCNGIRTAFKVDSLMRKEGHYAESIEFDVSGIQGQAVFSLKFRVICR